MDGVLCWCAPLPYVVTMLMPSNPSDSGRKAFLLLFARHSWLGHLVVRVTPPLV